jgi:uncharacterized cupredoxin-like copper-binding protein
LIPEIVTILVAAIMADETAQAAVEAVAVVVVAVEAAVVVVAVEAAVVVVAVEVAVATVDVTAGVVTAIAPITSKVIDALTTKRSRAIHTLVQTEVTVHKGKKSHSKDDRRSEAEVIEAVELAIVE